MPSTSVIPRHQVAGVNLVVELVAQRLQLVEVLETQERRELLPQRLTEVALSERERPSQQADDNHQDRGGKQDRPDMGRIRARVLRQAYGVVDADAQYAGATGRR